MAAPGVYRVPRRFVTFPEDPPPYGLLAVSFFAHMACFAAALGLSAYLGSKIDQSKVYIVNLVPATPSLGSPATQAPAPAPAARAPEPRPPAPKAEEKAPPKAPPQAPPQAAPRPPERVVEPPPPRAPEVAAARPKTLEPSELALPKRVEKETPALPPPPAPKAVERTLLPPPPVAPPTTPIQPAAPTRLPDPPRIAAPPAAPATPTTAAAPTAPPVAAARPGVEPLRLGRPSATTTSTGSIAVDASDFPFTYYLRLIQSKIGERWSPPRAAASGGERVIVLFEIQRDGQVREPTVEKSSGNALYDQSALRAITEASPFPPLPPEFKASSLRVHFGFEFSPGQG